MGNKRSVVVSFDLLETRASLAFPMFIADEATAEAVRRVWRESGDLAGVVELRRHFPLITDHARARWCVHAIVGWQQHPAPEPEPVGIRNQ